MQGNAVLDVKDLSANNDKGLQALQGCNLQRACAGEILGVAGVSGNGQKELVETLCGVRKPTAGQMLVNGKNVAGCSPTEISAAGVGRVPEDRHEGVVGEMTVSENMALDHMEDFVQNGMLDRKSMISQAEELIRPVPDQGQTARPGAHAFRRQPAKSAAGAGAYRRNPQV